MLQLNPQSKLVLQFQCAQTSKDTGDKVQITDGNVFGKTHI